MHKTDKSYEYWRIRIMYSTMIGYTLFYFVRKNLSMAMPGIEEELGITKAQLGIFLTTHGLLYGLSKFINGILADRADPRWFMSLGLLVCAIANFGFGMSSYVWLMGGFWLLNAWFQGMGFPPCAKSLTHWFSTEERGLTMAIWNTSHSVGAGFVFLLNAWVVWYFEDWRYCFFVPGLLAVLGAFWIFDRLRDAPETMGLDPIEVYNDKRKGTLASETVDSADTQTKPEQSWGTLLYQHVFTNPAVWIVCLSNFFIYIVRFSILDWAPTFLKEAKGIDIHHAGVVSSVYELIGVLGMLVSGWLMDRTFKGRGAKVCFIYMFGCTVTMALFWYIDSSSMWVNAAFLAILGFFIYGPQCLTGAIIANLATKKVASGAIGLGALFAYLSVVVTGWGIGWIADHYDWNAVFLLLVFSSAAGTLLFLCVFNAAAPEQIAAETRNSEQE